MSDAIETGLRDAVIKMQHYVDVYFAVLDKTGHLSAKQEAALSHDLDTLARNQRALTAYLTDPDYGHTPTGVQAVDIGPAPLPNHALPNTAIFTCPDNFDPAEFQGRHGFSVQEALDRVVTGLLRPDLDRWQKLVSKDSGFGQAQADACKAGDVRKQKSIIAYFAGQAPFEYAVLSYLGHWSDYLGCVDVAAIHDRGAA